MVSPSLSAGLPGAVCFAARSGLMSLRRSAAYPLDNNPASGMEDYDYGWFSSEYLLQSAERPLSFPPY